MYTKFFCHILALNACCFFSISQYFKVVTLQFTLYDCSYTRQDITYISSHTRTHAWLPHLCIRFDTSELITDKSDTMQSYFQFVLHMMSLFLNLSPPHVSRSTLQTRPVFGNLRFHYISCYPPINLHL